MMMTYDHFDKPYVGKSDDREAHVGVCPEFVDQFEDVRREHIRDD